MTQGTWAPNGGQPADPFGPPGAPQAQRTAGLPTAPPPGAPYGMPTMPGNVPRPQQRVAPVPPPAPEPAPVVPPPAAAPRAASGSDQLSRGTEQGVSEHDISLVEVLEAMLAEKSSDLHLTAGAPPTIRVNGELRPLQGYDVLTGDAVQRVMYAVMTQAQRERFEEDLELDFSYALPGVSRFRVNVYKQKEHIGAAFRVIPMDIKPLSELGVPQVVANFASLPRGFVLVTGPT